jgi:tetratricopeptide (TPR) repeat protein
VALSEQRVSAEATYDPGNGRAPDSPPDDATLWRLRARACWDIAAQLLAPYAPHDAEVSLRRAELLIERCLFTARGWDAAEAALRQAEAAAHTDRQRAAAACERGFLAYASTALNVHDRLDEAQAALGRASALLAPDDPRRALLHFRRGLVAEALLGDRSAARAAYLRAHAGAEQLQDDLLRSYTWRHLAALAQDDGNLAGARHGFGESLRLREELGFAVGIAPALVSLADVSPTPEAASLRAQARRLVDVFQGVPVWLARELDGVIG